MPLLVNLSFSIDLNASFPHIKWKGTSFGTLLRNFGQLELSTCHNQIGVLSIGLQMALRRNILYYITSHTLKSIEK
jgi:hypothetical protein